MKDVTIIGAGPAGLFTAYELITKNPNLKITLIDRGSSVDKRTCPMNEKGIPCQNCNPCAILSGYGGAGTFSDGKLNTLVKDKRYMQKKNINAFNCEFAYDDHKSECAYKCHNLYICLPAVLLLL